MNIVESELSPSSVAVTVLSIDVELGALKLAENAPLELVIKFTGIVVTGLPAKVMRISEFASKLMPVMFTKVPTGQKAGLIVMIGLGEDVTVNVAESELNPSLAVTVFGPDTEIGTSKSVSYSPLLLVVLVATLNMPKVVCPTIILSNCN